MESNTLYELLNSNSNSADDGSSLILLFVFCLVVFVCALVVFFVIKKRQLDASGAGAPGGHGARSPGQRQAPVTIPTDPNTPILPQVMRAIGEALIGLGVGAAGEALVSRSVRGLSSSVKSLMKGELRASTAFKNVMRPKLALRAVQKSWRKLMSFRFSRLSIWAQTRFGLMWAKSLAAKGESVATITAKIIARFGAERGPAIAARVTQALATKTMGAGPLVAAELAITGVGLGLDMTNTGGYMTIESRKTSDFLVDRQKMEAIQKNSYIQGPPDEAGNPDPTLAIGFYPAYWGPLDEMSDAQNVDGLDVFDILIEEKMFTMLFADDPDPFMTKLLVNLAKRYQVSPNDIQQALSATMLSDLTQDDYWGLYDRAFESLCISKGGVVVDPGGGNPKQCSHNSEARCHAFSPWTPHVGLQSDPDVDTTYTEWRNRDFFTLNYAPATLPSTANGACIVQDPAIHESCDSEKYCTSSGCAYNEYIRNMGVCQNTSDVCNVSGVSTCEHMRKPGGSGDTCETGAGGSNADLGPGASILPGNTTLRSCYVDSGQYWAELLLPTGSTIYRWFASGGPAALDRSIVNSQFPQCAGKTGQDFTNCTYQASQFNPSAGLGGSGGYAANYGWTGGSDSRLKKNLKKTGHKIGKLDEYTWEWNDVAKRLGITGLTTGVVAQEALGVYPEVVYKGEHGYYMINYDLLYKKV